MSPTQLGEIGGIHGEARARYRDVTIERLPGGQPQGHEALHRLVEHGLVEPASLVEQAIALLAGKADTLRNARQAGHQRRLPGTRQHDGAIEAAAQRAGHIAACFPAKLAVAHVQSDRLVHLRHALEHRQRPAGRHHAEAAARMARLEGHEQALGHHHVADPGGADHQDPLAAGLSRRGRLSHSATPGTRRPPRPRCETRGRSPPGAGCRCRRGYSSGSAP